MDTFLANIAKGRTVELYNRVKSEDPAGAALVLVPLSAGGSEAEGQDLDDLEALLAHEKFAEQDEGGWTRQVLTAEELAALPAPNDVDNRYDLQLPEISFGSPDPDNDIVGFAVGYDANTGSGDDGDVVFVGCMDNPVETDGNEVILKEGTFFQAS